MGVYLIILVTVLTHTSFKGSKVLISLYAIDLGANPFAIGVLFSMYSLFPVFLSVYAGRLSDRLGFRWPMLFGACGLLAGLLLPYFVPRIETLYVSAVLIGTCYIFYTVSVQHLIGSSGEGHERTRNYSLFSLGVALTSLLGPITAGFAIDSIGHRSTYLLLALFPALPILTLLFLARLLPKHQIRSEPKPEHRVMDLVRNMPLRRALITTGIVETGLELFNFYLPIYAHSIGFSASQIGIIMGAFALALLVVRTLMPILVRRSSEERVLSASLFLAGISCVLFPFVSSFTLLLVMSFTLGLGLGCGSPLSMVLAYNRSPPGRSGEAMGLRQTVNKATEVVVPIFFGTIGTALGMIPVFWLDAVMLAAGAMLMRRDVARSKMREGVKGQQ
ncbi:MAG: MFS transporter [Burkholderiales bacterium]|nr:MFS transporter [Burkholderiales bacterium]